MTDWICKEVHTDNGGYFEPVRDLICCKDCKYYSVKPEYHWGICEAHGNPPHVADETDWCSWAKRKDDDGTLQ